MNIHGLRVFQTIATEGGVSRAAEKLHISQPAVTMQLRKLEKELDLQLTRLEGRGIALTEAGYWLAAQAERLFALENNIEKQCLEYRRGALGSLSLSATYLPANYMLPGWLAEYRHAYPEVSVSLHSANAQTALDKLLRYETDIAWIGGQRHHFPNEVQFKIYARDELWFVAPTSHPLAQRKIAFEELLQLPLILREPGSFTRDALLTLCSEAGLPAPRPALQVNGPQEALRAVLAGLGVTLASAMEVKEYVDHGSVVQLTVEGSEAANSIFCCIRAGESLPPQAEAFLKQLNIHF